MELPTTNYVHCESKLHLGPLMHQHIDICNVSGLQVEWLKPMILDMPLWERT